MFSLVLPQSDNVLVVVSLLYAPDYATQSHMRPILHGNIVKQKIRIALEYSFSMCIFYVNFL